jgi:CDP-4-dehydro-6-deoxyglucose reductase
MPVVELECGGSFSADEGVSLLDAASASEVFLPYSCKTGRCSTCKCRILEGETSSLGPELGLTDEERMQGWVLSCVTTAVSDLLIAPDDLITVPLPPVKTLPCRISSLERVASDVLRVLLRIPPRASFEYLPGQYLDLIGPEGLRRSYSLASAQLQDGMIELHIRRVPGGLFSDYWFDQAKPNDLLRLRGPLGTFFLRDLPGSNLYFLATGTGIAPIKAMLESLRELPDTERPASVSVLWGGRRQEDFYMDIAQLPGDHSFTPVLSRADERWLGEKGYIQDVLLNKRPCFHDASVYACGSGLMIASAQSALCAAGLVSGRFYSDAFVCTSTNC